jgi:hypothetical protein
MADSTPPKVRAALIGGLLLVLGLASGAMLFGGGGAALPASVELEVPGAMSVSAYCGGDTTHREEGTVLRWQPAGARCDIEAPLTPSIPLRGVLEVGQSARYTCVRHHLDLVCGVAPTGRDEG